MFMMIAVVVMSIECPTQEGDPNLSDRKAKQCQVLLQEGLNEALRKTHRAGITTAQCTMESE